MQISKTERSKRLRHLFQMSLVMSVLAVSVVFAKEDNNITKHEAIERAKVEAQTLGYNVVDMRIDMDDNNSRWEEYRKLMKQHPTQEATDQTAAVDNKLSGKEYWAIKFSPPPPPPGFVRRDGGLWIFIERTGAILGVLRP